MAKKGEMTRQRIVELSAPLFNQRGFAGCSMSDIMEATGLEKGGIYRHFGSKEALAAEAFQFALLRTRQVRQYDVDAIPGTLNKLRRIMDRFVSEPSPVPGGCPLLNTAVDSDDGNTVLRDLVRKAFDEWRARLVVIVQAGIDSGEIKPSCRPQQLADMLVASMEGALLLSRLDHDKRALQNARECMEVVISSIAQESC